MKFMLTCVLLVCVAGYAGTVILADDSHPAEAFPDKPSESTIREFHAAVAAGDRRLAEKMVTAFPELATATLPDDDAAKQILPISTAVENGQTKMVAMLLGRGATYNTGNPGATPLFRAAILGHTNIIELLLDAGANVDAVGDPTNNVLLDNIRNVTPLRAALCCGKIDTAHFLVAKGAHIDIYSAAGLGWNGWVAKQIKEHPEQAALGDGWNFRPLTYAVACGCAGTADILLNAGADVNEINPIDHGTFLHIAAMSGACDLIAVMLDHNADVNVKNDRGETALDLAEKYKQLDAAQTFRGHGAKRGADL